MFSTLLLVLFSTVYKTEAKFYETELGPYGKYSTQEYDHDLGYPYGLAYKKYPYEHEVVVPKSVGYAGGIPGYGGLREDVGYYGRKGLIGVPLGPGYGYGPVGYSHVVPYESGLIAGHPPFGISQIDKGIYSDGKQNLVGEKFNYAKGYNGELVNHGDAGYAAGTVGFKDIKGDSLHFIDADGLKKGHHEGKQYNGAEYFDSEGKHGDEKVLNANHNKGHNIKGFKKSHHLDETGKTEEFFDHDHDQGGNYVFDGRFGKFGEAGGQGYKGGYSDGRFKTGEATKEGHVGNEYFQDKSQGNHGKFGENKFAENEEAYGLNKGFGERGLTAHHENSGIYKKHPGFGYY
ncbi:uncharacterized protein LOC130447922 [Diorhabda sublineata]|uniref:uncharacterized protein LOC130447922 n=1 Tax=Diorhabda sublineata TaxID=1163346 RepID=UPI0024E09CB1|nr:uncharacterized protein LOC130447922 [Diorhabda sublineata]